MTPALREQARALEERGVADHELKAWMQDAELWPGIVKLSSAPEPESAVFSKLIERAERLYKFGAPRYHLTSKRVEVLPPDEVAENKHEAESVKTATIAKAKATAAQILEDDRLKRMLADPDEVEGLLIRRAHGDVQAMKDYKAAADLFDRGDVPQWSHTEKRLVYKSDYDAWLIKYKEWAATGDRSGSGQPGHGRTRSDPGRDSTAEEDHANRRVRRRRARDGLNRRRDRRLVVILSDPAPGFGATGNR